MRPQIVMLIPLGEAPVDPGYGGGIAGARPGHDLPHAPGHPAQPLPMPPVDPSWGVGAPPVDPGYGHPGGGPRPGNELPATPVTKPVPPESPAQPGQIYPPLPGGVPSKALALMWVVGVGYRWVVLGPSPAPTA